MKMGSLDYVEISNTHHIIDSLFLNEDKWELFLINVWCDVEKL